MDPGGGYGWRAGRTGATPYGLGRRALRASTPRDSRPLGVLLLPEPLERFSLRAQASDLLQAPGVLAVEPARVSYEAYLRLPLGVGDGMAAIQAKRLKLPGVPRFVLIFGALQYPLARSLISEYPDCELWYAPEPAAAEGSRKQRERLEELHIAADHRATLRFTVEQLAGQERFPTSVWERVERLGIESGRLGSERADVKPFGRHGR
jgi:hypothetical protein